VRTKEILTFPGHFFCMIAPLNLEELDHLAPCDMIFWSRILIGCSGYVKSTLSGVTSGNLTSTGAFKHFFSYDMWKMIEAECPIFWWVGIILTWWKMTLTIRLRRASPKRQCNRWTNSLSLPTLLLQGQPDHEDRFLSAIEERTRKKMRAI
jgi:hypothetical protein